MLPRWMRPLLLLVLLQALLPVGFARADTGPKPTMEFTFQGEGGEPVTIRSGILYECDQPDCSDAAPIEELGPQRFYCETSSCRAIAYGFAPYHRIEIEFSSGETLESNVFETVGFDSRYEVTVRADNLLVEPRFTPRNLFPRSATLILMCLCALFAGLVGIGAIVFLMRRRSQA